MTQSTGFLNPDPQLVDGVDIDAVVAAVQSCPGVEDLDGGQRGSVASYLPGRTVAGIRVSPNRVTVQVRTRWGVPVAQVGAQLRTAVTPLLSGRLLDVVVSDIADPPTAPPEPSKTAPTEAVPAMAATPQVAALTLPAGPGEQAGSEPGGQEVTGWRRTSGTVADGSSASTIPTVVVTPPNSSPASPPSTSPHGPSSPHSLAGPTSPGSPGSPSR